MHVNFSYNEFLSVIAAELWEISLVLVLAASSFSSHSDLAVCAELINLYIYWRERKKKQCKCMHCEYTHRIIASCDEEK